MKRIISLCIRYMIHMSSKRKLTPFRRKYLRFRVSELRREVKLKCIEYKGGKCQQCGYSKCPGALVFHHIDPTEKEFAISSNGVSRSFEKCKPELDKCVLLCQNCHAEIHAEEYEKTRLEKIAELELEKRKIEGSIVKKCGYCQKEITVFASAESKFNYCNKACRTKHQNQLSDLEWIPDNDLLKMCEAMPVKDVAKNLGKSFQSVYKRLDKIKSRTVNK